MYIVYASDRKVNDDIVWSIWNGRIYTRHLMN